MDADFINDEWVENANNKQERGSYRPSKEEWQSWYLKMPNSRKGESFAFISFIKKVLK